MNANTNTDSSAPLITRVRLGGQLTLSLNRGERCNPLSMSMIAALESALEEADQDASIRVIVLKGEGRGFCAGHDLQEMRAFAGDTAWQRQLFESCARMMLKITQISQPVIARVHGIATAAGCQLVSMCDLAVAGESARFALPGINLGLFCSTPAVGVARNIGRKRSMQMLLTGDEIDAATALEWGLVNRVVASEKLDGEIRRLADRIMERSGAAIGIGKRAFYTQIESGISEAYKQSSHAMVCNLQLADAAEGIEAFLDKRPPVWRSQ